LFRRLQNDAAKTFLAFALADLVARLLLVTLVELSGLRVEDPAEKWARSRIGDAAVREGRERNQRKELFGRRVVKARGVVRRQR
jgi:hypothetical protein